MKKKQKYYVVWAGVAPGIYDSWTDCQLQTKGYEGARFKSFDTREEAERAFASSPYDYIGPKSSTGQIQKPSRTDGPLPPEVVENSLAVDAACSGNPGQMEYRGVHVASRQQVFKRNAKPNSPASRAPRLSSNSSNGPRSGYARIPTPRPS